MTNLEVSTPLSRHRVAVMGSAPRAAVLGVGNVMLGDDAFGPYVAALLAAGWRMPDDVVLLDAGRPRPGPGLGTDLADYLVGRRYAVILDSVKAAAPPGTVLTWHKADLLAPSAAGALGAGIDLAPLRDTLVSLALAGQCPEEVILVGAVPSPTHKGTGLSPVLRGAVMGAAEEVVRQLADLGFVALPLARRRVPDIWWERVPPETYG
jgi:hydrogenase maturation protease